jgi:hypothetical protein
MATSPQGGMYMATDPPAPEGTPGAQSGPGTDPPPARLNKGEWRQAADAVAAQIPVELPASEPVSDDAVRKLAADVAAELLYQLSQPPGQAAESEVQGFALSSRFSFSSRLSYDCTGAAYLCTESYACNTTLHSCIKFSCSGVFGCTGGPFSGFALRR